ncbi:MAG: putative modification/repair radical protein, partial [Verrucomicrobiaceae bacterium]|nr:putative modification/repair radical protein [Verrucomicrobiaceae bacterium]
GVRNVDRILSIRRWHALRLADLTRLRVPMKKTLAFIVTTDHWPHRIEHKTAELSVGEKQLELFTPDLLKAGNTL